MTDFLGELFL